MYKTIIFAADLTSEHSHLIAKAVEIAKHFNATLHLVHVIELPASVQVAQTLGFIELAHPTKDDAQTVLSLLAERYGIPPEQQHVEIGSVKEQLFKKAIDLGCGLIIIGNHTPGAVPVMLGSTARAVLHHPPCDVMTLRIQAQDEL